MAIDADIDREQIEQQLIQAIRLCLEAGDKEVPNITSDTIPLKDVKDFDSLCGIEVVVDLEEKLQCELGEDLFTKGSGKKATPRTIREIVDAILKGRKMRVKGVAGKNA